MKNWQKTEMKIKRSMSSFFHTNFFRSIIRRAKPLSYWLIVFLLWTNFVHAADFLNHVVDVNKMLFLGHS
jgi:hypothetical protein